MKKILFLFAILSCVFLTQAQDKVMTPSNNYVTVTYATLGASGSASKTIQVQNGDLYEYRTAVLLTKLTGTIGTVTVVEYTSLDGTNWVQVSSTSVNTSNATKYQILAAKGDIVGRYYKYTLTADSAVGTMTPQIQIKIWKK